MARIKNLPSTDTVVATDRLAIDGDEGSRSIAPSDLIVSAGPAVGDPIVILATGQSNFVVEWTLAWSPAANAKIWNWDGTTATVGTAFEALDATKMQVTWKFVSEVARANPLRTVYLINISHQGQAISHWKTGTGAPDVFADIVANVVPALAAIGVTKIDALLWWQGESDAASPSTYFADFETVQARFLAQSWFPASTPVTVFGVASTAVGGGGAPAYDAFNLILRTLVTDAKAELRRFVYPAVFGADFWDMAAVSGSSIHMNGVGYEQAGILAAREFLHGSGATAGPGTWTQPAHSMSGALALAGGAIAASPTPQLTMGAYYDSGGAVSVSHIAVYAATTGGIL